MHKQIRSDRRDYLITMTWAAIDGFLAGGLTAATDPSIAAVGLSLFGDCMRLNAETPRALRTWAYAADLEPAIAAQLAEIAGWWRPASLESDGAGFALLLRDQVASFHLAVTRVCIERQAFAEIPRLTAGLDAALAAFDARIGGRGSRRLVRRLLGDRVAMLGFPSWVEGLSEAGFEVAS